MPRYRRRFPGTGDGGDGRAERRATASTWRGAVPRRRFRARHLPRATASASSGATASRQRGAVRPFYRGRAPAGTRRRQHQHLLVRARLVLAHPAPRRHHQHWCGCSPAISSRARRARAFLHGHDRDRARSCTRGMRDAKLASPVTATGNYSYLARRAWPGTLRHGRRCFRIHRPGVLFRRVLRDEQRVARRRSVDGSLRDPARRRALERNSIASVRRGLSSFSWFIYRMTSPRSAIC